MAMSWGPIMPNLTLTYGLDDSTTPATLTLEEMKRPTGAITDTQAAQLANSLADRDPCGTDDPGTPAEPLQDWAEIAARAKTLLEETASALASMVWCGDVIPAKGEWQTQVLVSTSPPGLDYTLKGLDCLVGPGEMAEIMEVETIPINGQTRILGHPAATTCVFQGRVFDMAGREITPPELFYQDGWISWPFPVVGTIELSYPVTKTAHTVTCSAGTCMVMAYYAGGTELLTLTEPVPDDADLPCLSLGRTEKGDPCTMTTDYAHYCKCGGGRRTELDYTVSDEIECDGTGNKTQTVDVYVNCSSEDQDDSFFDPDHFETVCCFYGDPPPCKKTVATYGAAEPPTDDYPPGTVFIPVNQPAGPCGIHTTVWEEKPRNCCDGVALLEYDWDNSDETITSGGGAVVMVQGGKGPFTFKCFGSGYHFSNGSTSLVTDKQYAYVVAEPDTCGSVEVSVKDSCDQQTSGAVRNISAGQWVKAWYDRGGYDDAIFSMEACSSTVTQGQYQVKRSDWEMRSHCGNPAYQAPCSPTLRSACIATYSDLMWHPAASPSWGVGVGPCDLSNTCPSTDYETQFCRYDMWLREAQYDGWIWQC